MKTNNNTWYYAGRILLKHNMFANVITLLLLILLSFLGWGVFKILGIEIDIVTLMPYKWLLFGGIGVLHFFPVNLFAAKWIIEHPPKNVQIIVGEQEIDQ